ncbi:MAG: DUF502 domain-containing protein [Bacteroidetes bacterium]|nr:DUF502 domain-containing protein [Bacteroidota bacterium]
MKRIVRYFIQGILTAAPLFITFYIMALLFNKVGSVLHELGITIHPYIDSLIGFFGVIVLVILIGILASSLVFQSIMLVIDRTLVRTSFIKTIYSSVKDLLSAFLGSKKKFDKPVLVLVNKETGNQQLGFITQTDLKYLSISEGKVAVYMPHSYAFSGVLLIAPKENVTPLNAGSSEVMKFIVSGGVTDIDDHNQQTK